MPILPEQEQLTLSDDLNWHATPRCFCCSNCKKSLIGGQFAQRDKKLFCSKICVREYSSKM